MQLPIRFLWFGGPQPDFMRSNVERAREVHPGRDIEVLDDSVLWDGWSAEYDRQSTIGRADLLKMSIARRFGGWVIDADVWFFRPLDIYETIRPPNRGWWGTADTAHFGADATFEWDRIDDLLPRLRVSRNNVYDAVLQLAAWHRGDLFDVVPAGAIAMRAHSESGPYARLLNGLPVGIGSRLMLHGHKHSWPIPDSAVI